MLKIFSLADKKKVVIKGPLRMTKYNLPNGNTVQQICGKTPTMRLACTIISNFKTGSRIPSKARKTTKKSTKKPTKSTKKPSRK